MGIAQTYQSISRRPPDIEDYIDILRRYRSWIVAPMFAGLVISVVVAFLYPDTFVSVATMRITPQQVPERLIPSISYSQMAERLRQMQTELLSRSTLSEIIQKPSLDLYKKERNRLPMEDIMQEMRSRIRFLPITSSGDGKYASAFQISFQYTDKYKTQAVVRELVARFQAQNVQVLKNQANVTTTFLADELKGAKERMDSAGAAITKFQMENHGKLPEQAQANSQAMLQLQMQAMNIGQQIARDQQDKLALDTQLQNLRNEQTYIAANLETTVGGQTVAVRNEKLINLNRNIADLKQNLAAFQRTYGDNYPEIGTLKARIEVLEQEEAALEKEELAAMQQQTNTSGPRRVVNPEMERQLQALKNQQNTLQASISSKQMEIEELTRNRADVDKNIAIYSKRIEEAPLNERQYLGLLNDFNLAKVNYEEMVRRSETATTAQHLEDRNAGETLEVLDSPTFPDKAVDPNRLLWAGVGTFSGLLAGIMLAAVKEVKNTSLKNLKDVRAYTNLPVLTSVPLLENALLVRRKRRLVWLAWSSGVIVGLLMMAGSMYYYVSNV